MTCVHVSNCYRAPKPRSFSCDDVATKGRVRRAVDDEGCRGTDNAEGLIGRRWLV